MECLFQKKLQVSVLHQFYFLLKHPFFDLKSIPSYADTSTVQVRFQLAKICSNLQSKIVPIFCKYFYYSTSILYFIYSRSMQTLKPAVYIFFFSLKSKSFSISYYFRRNFHSCFLASSLSTWLYGPHGVCNDAISVQQKLNLHLFQNEYLFFLIQIITDSNYTHFET